MLMYVFGDDSVATLPVLPYWVINSHIGIY